MVAGFALPHGLVLGDVAVVSEPGPVRGLGRLRDFVDVRGETRLAVEFPAQGRSLLLSADGAAALARPMSESDAEAMFLTLDARDVQTDECSPEDKYVASVKTLSRGTWHDVGRQLAVLYASPWKPTLGELRMIEMYEAILVPILAHALEREPDAVREQLRADKAVFSATDPRPASRERPDTPGCIELAGWESLYPIELSGEVWIGERPDWHDMPENGLAHLHVAPGRWHSYRHHEEDEEDDAIELLLVHETHTEAIRTARWRKEAEILSVVGAGTVNVVDRAALSNESTMDRVRYLGGVREYGGHALCVATHGWKGPLPVFVAPGYGLPTMVKIPLRDEEHG